MVMATQAQKSPHSSPVYWLSYVCAASAAMVLHCAASHVHRFEAVRHGQGASLAHCIATKAST